MAPVHFELFVSCEDQLPKVLGQVHNVACTVTGIVLMGLPYRTALLAWTKTPPSSPSSSPYGTTRPDVVAYLAALTFLFYINLHQHVAGSFVWDLDVGGALHSIFLSLMVYEHCKEILHQQVFLLRSLPTLPTAVTRALAAVAALVELATPFVFSKNRSKGREIASMIGNVAALTVVPFMGYLSWLYRQVDQKRSFFMFLLACVALKGAEQIVQIEASLICDMKPVWIPRLFHSIITHAEIWLLFYAVTECAFSVIQFCSKSEFETKRLSFLKKQK
jgi:hypothetical protein